MFEEATINKNHKEPVVSKVTRGSGSLAHTLANSPGSAPGIGTARNKTSLST